MRHMHVLGVELQDYTVREAMRKTEYFFKDGKVRTIVYITTRGLMAAEESPQLREFLGNVDMTVAADSDILRAAGGANRNRIKEIDNDEFMEEFLKKVIRSHRTVYLLAGKQEQLQRLEECLKTYQQNLRIVGRFSLDNLEQDEDYLINEINGILPDVLISNMDTPLREEFFENNHMKMNTGIWLMLKDEVIHATYGRNLFWKITDRITKTLFRKKVVKYQSQESEKE